MLTSKLLAQNLQHKTPPIVLKSTASSQPAQSFATGITKMVVSDPITKDHRELEEYYNNILNASDTDTKVRWQKEFTWELARHSIAEELVVYPAMEQHLRRGKEMAKKDRREHRVVKDALYKFQNLKPEDPEFEPTLRDLMSNLSQHIKEEERDDLPALEEALDTDESDKLATSFQRAKKLVSHPSASDRPPYETVAGLMAAPIDWLRDLFSKFSKEKSDVTP